ncbi:MAG: TlpA family protein disulfide reductase [Gemmatimonadales bacterium]
MKMLLHAGVMALLLVGVGRLAAQESGIPVGSKAPAVKVNDLEGTPVDLAQYIGKQPVLLEFWATWCEQCEALQPQLDRIQKEMGSQINVVAVAVGVSQTPRRVKLHVQGHNPGYPYVFDNRGDAVRKYDAATTSVVMLLDKNGKVVYANVGPEQDLLAAVKKVLGAATQE